MAAESGGWSWPWPSAVLDKPNDQLRRFDTRHHPANLVWRYCRHHFGRELETFAERHPRSHAPRHSGHAGTEHRGRFDDDGPDRWAASVAKGQSFVAGMEELSWSRLSEQLFRVDKWSVCRVRLPCGGAAG
jgi:hypothetical protein